MVKWLVTGAILCSSLVNHPWRSGHSSWFKPMRPRSKVRQRSSAMSRKPLRLGSGGQGHGAESPRWGSNGAEREGPGPSVLSRASRLSQLLFRFLRDHLMQAGASSPSGRRCLLEQLRHRPDVGRRFHHPFDDFIDVGGTFNALRRNAVGIGKLNEVWVAWQWCTGLAVVKEQFLPLANHAEVVVVDDQDLRWDVFVCGGS